MGRSPCCSKEGLNRGAWTAHEDKILTDYISLHGEGRWRNLPKRAGLKRCGKSCRLRWLNYLRPDIKRGNITPDEEELIIRLHNLLGNRWSLIAGRLPGRTDNEIKNYWNTNLGKRVKDPRHQNTTIVSSSSRRPSAQPGHVYEKASKSTIPMTQVTPNNTLPSPNSPSGSHVVRTKATKCSKVFINPHLPPPPPPNSSEEPRSSCDQTTEAVVKAYDDSGLSPFGAVAGTEQERWSSSSDLLEDFNVGELCLSDLLNSDFSEMCDFSAHSNKNNNSNSNSDALSPSCCDQPFVFSDEILHDWTQTNAAEANDNVPTNLHCFTSFLECSDCEEWVAE